MQGASILILGLRWSIISEFQGEGVPQNRLMRADDSCRVENAEGSRCARSGPFAPPREMKLSSRLRTRNGASANIRMLFRPGMLQLGTKIAAKNEAMRIAVEKGTPTINR
jgi:hypothetical protein